MRKKTILILLLLLTAIITLAACSGGEHLLLAEYNRDAEAEIILAELGAEQSEWQTLAKDVERTFLFAGDTATFIPDSNRILLWYVDGNDIRIEQMEIGDEAPTEILEADADMRLFGTVIQDPFTVFVTETRGFDSYRCYVSQDGAKADRRARGSLCFMSEQGVIQLDLDQEDGTTLTLISLDGEEETVILDEVEDVGTRIRYNQELTQFVYMVPDRDEAQLFLIEPGAEEGEPLGEAFAIIDEFGFLGDGETVYVSGKLDEDDNELGLFINGTGEPLIEADDIIGMGQSEDGKYAIFMTTSGDEMTAVLYSVDEGTVTELLEGAFITQKGFPTEDYFLLQTEDGDEQTLYSVRKDGSEVIELLSTDAYDILSFYMNHAADQLLVQLRHEDGSDAVYVTSLNEENGYFLVEDWYSLTILTASEDQFIFWGKEDEEDDYALYSIPWAEDASEVELDDDADFGYRTAFLSEDGRSLYYTAVDRDFTDFEVRLVPVDGSERPERLYRDKHLLDVSWEGEPNLEQIR
ncbi:MAG: hypothetical protein H6653_06790 [Ardenticatenaceae bacterium]|nr:hypothetical protein [Ardenticatenaceae bacterium]